MQDIRDRFLKRSGRDREVPVTGKIVMKVELERTQLGSFALGPGCSGRIYSGDGDGDRNGLC